MSSFTILRRLLLLFPMGTMMVFPLFELLLLFSMLKLLTLSLLSLLLLLLLLLLSFTLATILAATLPAAKTKFRKVKALEEKGFVYIILFVNCRVKKIIINLGLLALKKLETCLPKYRNEWLRQRAGGCSVEMWVAKKRYNVREERHVVYRDGWLSKHRMAR
jgi:hypothetical protein